MKIKSAGLAIMLLFSAQAIRQKMAAQAPALSEHVSLNRKIELMVRRKYDVPSDCEIKVGPRTPSSVPGYDQLRITISQGQNISNVDFLISLDNRSLGRLQTLDLDGNPAVHIDIHGSPIRGNPDAPVTVINFDDLECPVCAYMNQQLFPAALDRYGSKVRFIYLDSPLIEIHPWALHAAVDATCLASQSQVAYWSYVDYVHAHVQDVSGDSRNLPKSFSRLDSLASEEANKEHVDSLRLQACLRTQDEVPLRQSIKQASSLGVNFTPALFVNGEEVHGFRSIDDVYKVIDRALRETKDNTREP